MYRSRCFNRDELVYVMYRRSEMGYAGIRLSDAPTKANGVLNAATLAEVFGIILLACLN